MKITNLSNELRILRRIQPKHVYNQHKLIIFVLVSSRNDEIV